MTERSNKPKKPIPGRSRGCQNPYAFIDASDEPGEPKSATMLASPAQISADRLLLENQHAHVDGEGMFSALLPENTSTSSSRIDRQPSNGRRHDRIERAARDLQLLIWRHREELYPAGVPTDPVDLLDPAIAARMMGYSYEEVAGFGRSARNIDMEVAGELDRRAKCIRISAQFPRHIQRFTAAHELGHARLHNELRMHRDRPIGAPRQSSETRDKQESEADKFAASFLMPEKLVRKRFQQFFFCKKFVFDDNTIFALNRSDCPDLYRKGRETIRPRSRTLASATVYNGRHFVSLADQFHVSVETMAIRLEELELIEV